MNYNLVSLSGQTPQIITETIYAFSVAASVPVLFDALHIITTTTGKSRVEQTLVAEGSGELYRLCHDYHLPIPDIHLHTITGGDGTPLADVRTGADNEAAANSVMVVFRNLCALPETALYCSIAGGRKTMSSYGMLAFSLFARPQDKLSHVLVSPPEAERSPMFYYPPPSPCEITGYNGQQIMVEGKPLMSNEVHIDFAELPCVRLRTLLKKRGLDLEGISFNRLVEQVQLLVDEGGNGLLRKGYGEKF